MKKFNDVLKIAVGGVLIFVFGLYMGSELDFTSLSSIEGYLYGANNATPSDATSGNATSGNATSGNATSGNATSGNATSGNATSGNSTSSNVTTPSRNQNTTTTTKTYVNSEIVKSNLSEASNNMLDYFVNTADGSSYVITVDNTKIADSSLFNSIKGTDKTLDFVVNDNRMIFNGKDIVNPKSLNVYFEVQPLTTNKKIEEKISSGYIINFENSGTLPGKAKVKIKGSSDTNSKLGDKNYVYYYNETEDYFEKVAENVSLSSDGYYEFTITHNSNYVITKEEIKDAEVRVDGKTKVSFQKSKTFQILLICGGALVAIAAATTMFIINKKNLKKTEENKEKSETEIPTTTNEFPWDKDQK